MNLMILRRGAFFEGFSPALDTIRHEGVVADSVAPEAKVPMNDIEPLEPCTSRISRSGV